MSDIHITNDVHTSEKQGTSQSLISHFANVVRESTPQFLPQSTQARIDHLSSVYF